MHKIPGLTPRLMRWSLFPSCTFSLPLRCNGCALQAPCCQEGHQVPGSARRGGSQAGTGQPAVRISEVSPGLISVYSYSGGRGLDSGICSVGAISGAALRPPEHHLQVVISSQGSGLVVRMKAPQRAPSKLAFGSLRTLQPLVDSLSAQRQGPQLYPGTLSEEPLMLMSAGTRRPLLCSWKSSGWRLICQTPTTRWACCMRQLGMPRRRWTST